MRLVSHCENGKKMDGNESKVEGVVRWKLRMGGEDNKVSL